MQKRSLMHVTASNTIERTNQPAAIVDAFRQKLKFSPRWENPFSMACKRIIDVISSAMLLALFSPLLLGLAVAVWLSSPGSVFYRWEVVGKGGRPFVGYKFRSMYRDADQLKRTLEGLNEMRGPVFKVTNDPRVTPLGRWM